jgi:hypothetical protein
MSKRRGAAGTRYASKAGNRPDAPPASRHNFGGAAPAGIGAAPGAQRMGKCLSIARARFPKALRRRAAALAGMGAAQRRGRSA